ncbi:odorant receptor Or1-like isoform X2 [Megalopta genalis]|uniref:odorant receptor Or1-like isoform X2 n=1 Tax=Megalopta genalis TaxID=115081 RepID=UPI003FCF6873
MTLKSRHQWLKSFRSVLYIQVIYLTYCGLWSINPNNRSILRCGYFLWKIFIIAVMYIFTFTLFADVYTNMDDISVATDSGCICAGIVVVIFKIMNYQFNRKEIERLIEKIVKCADDLIEFSDNSDRITDIIKGHYTFNNIMYHGFRMIGCFLVIALLLFSPMEDGLPIRAKYPFNTTVSPYHEIALTVEIFAVTGGVLAILSMDGITLTMCNFAMMQINILSVNFENCGRQPANDTGSVYRNPTGGFMSRYKACLRFHQRLMSMINDYNNIYSSSVFVQMVSSTSIICLTGFQAVVVGGQNSDIIKFGVYLSAAMSQLFYICWMGNELTYAFSVLDRGQWLSDWHRESFPDIVQVFVLATMSTRHSIYLKAGPFFVTSLQVYIMGEEEVHWRRRRRR